MTGARGLEVAGEDAYLHRTALMGTVVTITVIGHRPAESDDSAADARRRAAVERAVAWFEHVEGLCSRFDPDSELSQLGARPGVPTKVSPVLFQALRFATALAEETGRAFDPTVGRLMEERGFDVNYRTGKRRPAARGDHQGRSEDSADRDLRIDDQTQMVTVMRPLTLDLGAVAKGLAVDLAARELHEYPNICVEAGGDAYVRGSSGHNDVWTVGIRHPRSPDTVLETIRITEAAVCTSGDYERPAPDAVGGHHIVDPRTRTSPSEVASVTVVAPTTMLADGLATAAFVLGSREGIELLDRHGVEGLLVTQSLDRYETRGFNRLTLGS